MIVDTVLIDDVSQDLPVIDPVLATEDTVLIDAVSFSPVVAPLSPSTDTVQISVGDSIPVVSGIQAFGDTVIADYTSATDSLTSAVASFDAQIKAILDEINGVNDLVAENNAAANAAFIEVNQSVLDNNAAANAAFAEINQLVLNNNTAADATFVQVKQSISDNAAAANTLFGQLSSSITDNSAAIATAQGQITDAFTQLSSISKTVADVKSTADGNTAELTVQQGALTTLSMSLTGQITTLNANIGQTNANLTSEQLARTTADQAITANYLTLQSTVGDNYSSANSQFFTITTNIASLSTNYTAIKASNDSNTAAISQESSARATGDSTNATAITSLDSKFTSGLATTNSNVTQEVNARTDAISSLVGTINSYTTSFNNQIASTQASVTAETSARSSADQAITAQYNTLNSQVNDPATGLPKTVANLQSEQVTRANADSALTTSYTSLAAQINDPNTGLPGIAASVTSEASARASADSSLSGRIDTQNTNYGNLSSALTQESATRSSADMTLAGQYSTLNSQVNDPNTGLPKVVANLSSEQVTRANADSALTTSYTNLAAQVNNPTTGLPGIAASVTSEASTRASADSSLSGRIDTQATNYGNLSSALTQESATRSSADQTLAGQYTSLSSSYNTLANNQAAGSGGGNQFPNSELSGIDGWSVVNSGGANATLGFNNPNYSGNGVNVVYAVDPGSPSFSATGAYFDIYTPTFPCTGGALYEYSVYAAYHRAQTCKLYVAYYDAANNFLGYGGGQSGGVSGGAGGGILTNFQRIGTIGLAPATAVKQQLLLRLLPDGEQSPYSWFTRPYVGIATPGQTQLSPYSPGTQANVPGLMASLTSESVTRANADSALTTSYTNLAAQVNNPTTGLPGIAASVTSEASARASADSALSGRIDTQTSNYNNLSSSLTQEAATRSSADQTLAGQYTSLSSSYNTLAGNQSAGSGGGNDLPNSDLIAVAGQAGNYGWTSGNTGGGGASSGFNTTGYYNGYSGVLFANSGTGNAGGTYTDWDSPIIPAEPGVLYEASVMGAGQGKAALFLYIGFYNAAGSLFAYSQGFVFNVITNLPANNGALSDFTKIGGFATAPAGTAARQIKLRTLTADGNNAGGFFQHPFTRAASPGQTQLSPYSSGTQSNSSAITASLSSESVTRANADSAISTSVTNLQSTFSGGVGGGNMIANSDMNGIDNYSFASSSGGSQHGYVTTFGGVGRYYSYIPNGTYASAINDFRTPLYVVTPGTVYEASVLAENDGMNGALLYVQYYDSNNNNIANPQWGGAVSGFGSNQLPTSRIGGFTTAPSNAVTAQLLMRQLTTPSGAGYVNFAQPVFRVASPNQTQLSPYSPGTQANVTAITASITNESATRASADSAMATNIQTLQTNQGNDHASISTLTTSVNGLSVQFAVVGTIDNNSGSPTYGGFIFSGVKQANGTVTYNTVFNSNVVINGSLIVNSTLDQSSLNATSYGNLASAHNLQFISAPGAGTFVVPPGVYWLYVKVWGGGAGSIIQGGSSATGGPGAGYTYAAISVSPGQNINYFVGSGGPGGNAYNGNCNASGTSSSFGSLSATGGQLVYNNGNYTLKSGMGSGGASNRPGTVYGGAYGGPPATYGETGYSPGGGGNGFTTTSSGDAIGVNGGTGGIEIQF